ncbi:MAG: hypothetical protein M1821_000873 [Bathelium mastoideum]|nr:MAG: hypothetical protein M1821_000873 [Bathelium mastoideum]
MAQHDSTDFECDDFIDATAILFNLCQQCWQATEAPESPKHGQSEQRSRITPKRYYQREEDAQPPPAYHGKPADMINSSGPPKHSKEELCLARLGSFSHLRRPAFAAVDGYKPRLDMFPPRKSLPSLAQLESITKYLPDVPSSLRQVTNISSMDFFTVSDDQNDHIRLYQDASPPLSELTIPADLSSDFRLGRGALEELEEEALQSDDDSEDDDTLEPLELRSSASRDYCAEEPKDYDWGATSELEEPDQTF